MEQPSINRLKQEYEAKKTLIKSRLEQFRKTKAPEHLNEFLFCILTPQSNAQKCWQAVEQLSKLQNFKEHEVNNILKSKTRFHNNKTRYILENRELWHTLKGNLNTSNIKELRNSLAEKVKGYGLKEASHFLRNIGKSNNQIAILDRHILKNLKSFNIIKETKIRGKKDYLAKEQQYLNFASQINIPADELDLLWWSQENGEIFK